MQAAILLITLPKEEKEKLKLMNINKMPSTSFQLKDTDE